jgi:transmembrane sensor
MEMSPATPEIERAALGWLVRINDPEFNAWSDWEAWLGQDPRHAETYWRLAAREAELTSALSQRAPPTRPATATPLRAGKTLRPDRPAWSRSSFRAAAAAAVAAALVGAWYVSGRMDHTWTVETAPGERRLLALADGTTLHLDGGTEVELDRRRPREALLERGRLLAEVVHDERRPFVLTVGDAVLTDLGTAFDVTRLPDGLRVAVSEGVVRVDHPQGTDTLHAGQSLLASGRGVSRRDVAPAQVGAWLEGRLTYQDEPLAVIAQDLERAVGRPVTVSPEIAARRFTGSLRPTGAEPEMRSQIELVLGVRIVSDAQGWRLEPGSGA